MKDAALFLMLLAAATCCRGATITVDDDGPADFNSIQAAIDDCNDGDTIIVQEGTYCENVVVSRSITLRGQGMPVVDANDNGNAVTVTANACTIEGIKVTGASDSDLSGLKVESDDNVIRGMICENNAHGVRLVESSNNTVTDCIVSNNLRHGFWLKPSNGNVLKNNTANMNGCQGLAIGYSSHNNTVTHNTFEGNGCSGIYLSHTNGNGVTDNTILRNEEADISLNSSNLNSIVGNVACGIVGDEGTNTIADNTCPYKADLSTSSSDIELSRELVYASTADKLFRGLFEMDMAALAREIGGIEEIDVAWRGFYCLIGITFSPGLSSSAKIALQSQVQCQVSPSWYIRYVERNHYMCIPEDPFCPPWPGYVIGELLAGFNDSSRESGVITATIRNEGQTNAHSAVVQLFDRDLETGESRQIGGDYVFYRVYAGETATVRVAWDLEDGHNVCVRVDPYDSIEESSESNNQACMNERKTIYVDDDFTDDPANHRWDTIQEGIDDACMGDVVVVHPGTYSEDINFLGRDITVAGTEPMSTRVVRDTIIRGTVRFRGTEGPACRLKGFKVDGSIVGYDWEIDPSGENHTHATISHCILENVATACGGLIQACDGTISNCVIANISYMCLRPAPVGQIVGSHGLIRNCTMVNMHDGIEIAPGGTCTIEGCILYRSSPIIVPSGATVNISYCDTVNGWTPISFGDGTVNWGPGNIDNDPCFVRPATWKAIGDYHLKSQAGRYHPNSETWVQDDVTSLCVDAGNPISPIGPEPFPNGGIINMGTYGGTMEASKSYFGKPPCETIVAGDVNGDCEVNFLDFRLTALHWMEER